MQPTFIPLTPDRERAERLALRRGRNARPTMTRRSSVRHTVDGAGETRVTVRGAALLVYVRNTADARRELARFCGRVGGVAELVWEAPPGEPDAWKVVAEPAALAKLGGPLSRPWWVKAVELLTTARVGGAAAGGGEWSEGAKRRARTQRELRLKDGERPPTGREAETEQFVAVLSHGVGG